MIVAEESANQRRKIDEHLSINLEKIPGLIISPGLRTRHTLTLPLCVLWCGKALGFACRHRGGFCVDCLNWSNCFGRAAFLCTNNLTLCYCLIGMTVTPIHYRFKESYKN